MTDDTTAPAAPPKSEPPLPTPDPIFSAEEVARIIDFHGTPVAAQVLREVLGALGRTAAWAARKQPKNRPEFLREWNPPHLRQLAALCEAYAPEVGVVNAPRDPDLFPTAVSPNDPEAQHAEIASHRAQVVRERAAASVPAGTPTEQATQIIAEALGAEAIEPELPPAAPMFHLADPVDDAEWEALTSGAAPLFHLADPDTYAPEELSAPK